MDSTTSSTATGARVLKVRRSQTADSAAKQTAAASSTEQSSSVLGTNDPLMEEVLMDLLADTEDIDFDEDEDGEEGGEEEEGTAGRRQVKAMAAASKWKEDSDPLGALPLDTSSDDEDGSEEDAVTTASGTGKRVRPNANFLSRLMASTSSLNTRIIQESEGLLPVAGPKGVFTSSFIAKRRRGIALVNRIAQKYGLRLILLPANPHNADPSDRRAEHHVTSCSSCGSEVRVSTQVARGLGQPSGVGSASDDAHMPTRVKGTGPLPLQVDCQIKGSGKQEGQAGTEAKQKAKEEDGGEGGETNQSQRWKVKENGASSGAWATSTTASHTPAPGDLLPPPPTPPPLSALMSGILLLPSNQVASLSSSEILPSPVKRRSAAPAAVSNVGNTGEEGPQVKRSVAATGRGGKSALGGALAMLKRSLHGAVAPSGGAKDGIKRVVKVDDSGPMEASKAGTATSTSVKRSEPTPAAAQTAAATGPSKRRRVVVAAGAANAGAMKRMLQGAFQMKGGRGRGAAAKPPLSTKPKDDRIPGSGER